MALDANIANNLFTEAGSVGANLASSKITQTLNSKLFSKLGNSTIGNAAKGFLSSQTANLIKNFLFTSNGVNKGTYDPVWKLSRQTFSDPHSKIPVGDLTRAVADDFAGADHPKYKFNFTVSFLFRDSMNDILSAISNSPADYDASFGSDLMSEMAFGLRTATRPNPTVVYQDINLYNYRTKIATKVDYGTITLTFYDDINNRAHDIFNAYLNSISPISTIQNDDSADLFDQMGITPEDFQAPNSSGVLAPISNSNVAGDINNTYDVSSLGKLPDEEEAGPIKTITLTQHLPLKITTADVNSSAVSSNGIDQVNVTATAGGRANLNQYVFYNPRIISMALDDLDMSSSDVSTVSLTFAYDAVYLKKEFGPSNGKYTTFSKPANKSIFGKFLSSIDDKINPVLQGVNDAVKNLNNSTAANEIKSVTAGLF
jgi:hypothetical protein